MPGRGSGGRHSVYENRVPPYRSQKEGCFTFLKALKREIFIVLHRCIFFHKTGFVFL